MHTVIRTGLVFLLTLLAFGQTTDKSLNFEVASVKVAEMPKPDGQGRILMAGPSGGPGTRDPGRIRYPFTNLRNLLTIAYDVKSYQISGPPTLDTERFEINATMPPERVCQLTREKPAVWIMSANATGFGNLRMDSTRYR